jgi:hypothetical protein
MPSEPRNHLQVVWGVLLVAAGVGMFFRIPQVAPQIREIPAFAAAMPFIYFCLYFVALALLGGGAKKIYQFGVKPRKPS